MNWGGAQNSVHNRWLAQSCLHDIAPVFPSMSLSAYPYFTLSHSTAHSSCANSISKAHLSLHLLQRLPIFPQITLLWLSALFSSLIHTLLCTAVADTTKATIVTHCKKMDLKVRHSGAWISTLRLLTYTSQDTFFFFLICWDPISLDSNFTSSYTLCLGSNSHTQHSLFFWDFIKLVPSFWTILAYIPIWLPFYLVLCTELHPPKTHMWKP